MKHPMAFATIAILIFLDSTIAGAAPFASASLRGYGKLSASSISVANSPASTLKIACESDDKAKLTLAKYVSDLQLLPGVSPLPITVHGVALPGWAATGQGAILAARDGRVVYIFAAAKTESIATIAEATLGTRLKAAASAPETTVPTFLDRFDKYGFESYYQPFRPVTSNDPPGTKRVYDPVGDMKYAQQIGHAGLVVPFGPEPDESADGIGRESAVDWLFPLAQKYELPMAVNLDVYSSFAVLNRHPEQVIQYQPQFQGGWYGSMNFGEEINSWNGLEAKDEALGQVQQNIRRMAAQPNMVDWLEPHSEMGHGIADLLLEYGPVADANYRTFLKSQYGTLATLSERWYHDTAKLKSWDDVRVPEIWSFVGYGLDAIDLTGQWKRSTDAPFDATSAVPSLDDSAWPTVPAPGHAIVRFLDRKPAVYRRHVNVPADWKAAHTHVWISVWDFNRTRKGADGEKTTVQIYVNGTLIPEAPPFYSESHFATLDVSSTLVAGNNLITITLPNGFFNGRVFLTSTEPRNYPDLGPTLNAQWADYSDFNRSIRSQAVYRGTQMIRQIDPSRGVKLAAPGEYVDGISQAAKDYGGEFHDTGAQAGFWNERIPAIMRGCGLPASAEPGSAAPNATEFKAFMGRWITEGVNQIDYFQFFGDLEFMPDVRACLDENKGTYLSVGKYHGAPAEVAALYSERNSYLTGFPWLKPLQSADSPSHLGSGYWTWNPRAVLRNLYDSDGVMDVSFDSDDVSKYKVIIDSNTSIIDQKLLDGIERYVRNGGTFVTYVQTGRHTGAVEDAWPIEKLTGYHVTRLAQPSAWRTGMLAWTPGQPIFSGDWADQARADGLSMTKVAPDCVDLATWKDDGSVAIGMRRLGKGTIIEVGCRFTRGGLPQRIDYDIWNYYKTWGILDKYGLPQDTTNGLWSPELHATSHLFDQILRWRGVQQLPVRCEPNNEHLIVRHDISNNGLYDVWELWNDSHTDSVNGLLKFTGGYIPGWRIDVNDGAKQSLVGGQIAVALTPLQTVIYLTPRSSIIDSPAEWYRVQCGWWQGTADPGKPFPKPNDKLTVDMTDDWAFMPLATDTDAKPLAGANVDVSKWPVRKLGIFTLPDYPDVRHAIFRKTFTVPSNWNKGRVLLSIHQWNGEVMVDKGQIYFDGKPVGSNLKDDPIGGSMRAGTTHTIAVEVSGNTTVVGLNGPAWLSYHPDPAERLDLTGPWDLSSDKIHYTAGVLPGPTTATTARKTVKIDASESGRTVVVHELANWGGALHGLIINGRFVTRHHHWVSPEQNLNITPYVNFGQDNELILVLGGGQSVVKNVSLEFHKKGTYP